MSPSRITQHFQPVRRRRIRAFSLIELSFAIAVIVVGSAGVLSALLQVQRNSIVNRAHTNAYNILRNVLDQSMQHGWNTVEDPTKPLDLTATEPLTEAERKKSGPKQILRPTIAGTTAAFIPNPGDPGSLLAKSATVAGDPNWRRWSMYNAADVVNIPNPDVTAAPVYEDYNNPEKDIPGRVYRKVQYVQNDRTLVWVTFRIEYTYRGVNYAHHLCGLRAID